MYVCQQNFPRRNYMSGIRAEQMWRGPAVGQVKRKPDILLLTPAIFGGAAAFILGFGFHGRCLTSGYHKFIFFINILAIISSLGVGAYIYELLKYAEDGDKFVGIVPPLLIIVFFYAAVFNLVYSLYPETYRGTIGDTRLSQFFSFLALSAGTITVGETFGVEINNPGAQILNALEGLFALLVFTLIISLAR